MTSVCYGSLQMTLKNEINENGLDLGIMVVWIGASLCTGLTGDG